MTTAKLSTRARLAKLRTKIRAQATTKSNYGTIVGLPDLQPQVQQLAEEVGLFYYGSIIRDEKGVDWFVFEVSNVDDAADNIEIKFPAIPAQIRGAQPLQQLGGTLTYLTRYAFYQMLGISSASEDPDANEAEKAPTTPSFNPPFKPGATINPMAALPDDDLPIPTIVERIAQINTALTVDALNRLFKAMPDGVQKDDRIIFACQERKKALTEVPDAHK